MSSESAKKRARGNSGVLRRMLISISLVSAVSILLHFFKGKNPISVPLVVCSLVEGSIYYLLHKISNYTVVKGGGKTEIIVQVDLKSRGALQILQDIFYLSLLIKSLSAWAGKKILFIYILTPASLYYEFFWRRKAVNSKIK